MSSGDLQGRGGPGGTDPDERRERVADVLALVGLTKYRRQRPAELSGGQLIGELFDTRDIAVVLTTHRAATLGRAGTREYRLGDRTLQAIRR